MSVETIYDTRQYLTFKLGDEVFAVDVSQVREILEYTAITRVPKVPDFMRGVINVRGSVVPVVDMRLKFGMSETQPTINTCIIVLEVTLEGENVIIGALTDSVQEVFELAPGQIEPAPRIGMQLSIEFIRGIGKHDEEFVIILDIDKIFSGAELASVVEAGEAAGGVEAPEEEGEAPQVG